MNKEEEKNTGVDTGMRRILEWIKRRRRILEWIKGGEGNASG